MDDGPSDKPRVSEKARLERKKLQTDMRLNAIYAREKIRDRAKDTRRKILIGAAMMAAIKKGSVSTDWLIDILYAEIVAERDKVLIDEFFSKLDE